MPDLQNGNTALDKAVQYEHWEVVELLVAVGAMSGEGLLEMVRTYNILMVLKGELFENIIILQEPYAHNYVVRNSASDIISCNDGGN